MAARAYIGLGSNLADPEQQVSAAISALDMLPDSSLVSRSSLYRSPPMGPQDQPDFVNAVACLETDLAPRDLLLELLRVEREAGRDRAASVHWGPRVLDLDLLVYANKIIDESELTVPHPGLAQRAFVLEPLNEIAPDLDVPGMGKVSALLKTLGDSALERVPANH